MAPRSCDVLEFPQRQPARDNYSIGWLDGCRYGEQWARSRLFCVGVFAGVMLAIIVGGLIFWFGGAR